MSCTRAAVSWATRRRSMPRFFFQAEDGIRDLTVTGVQTCALPIFMTRALQGVQRDRQKQRGEQCGLKEESRAHGDQGQRRTCGGRPEADSRPAYFQHRSEERRVGKEGRSRWAPYH